MNDKKTILCVDTGVDDALAITYALASPELDLIGITVSYGMAPVEQTYSNTKQLVRSLGSNIPVYMGSADPLVKERIYGGNFHGPKGMGNAVIEDVSDEGRPEEAIDFIIESIRQYGADLQIITTGPLTDLAKVMTRYPEAIGILDSVVCMGGAAITPGNCSIYAEANVWIDPHAAKICLESGLRMVMVGLDVTRKTLLTQKDLDVWKAYDTKAARIVSDAVDFYLAAYQKFHPYLAGCALHDPLAVGVAFNRNFVKTVPFNLTVITEGEAMGRMTEDLNRMNEVPTAEVALEVKSREFMEDFYAKVNQILRTCEDGV